MPDTTSLTTIQVAYIGLASALGGGLLAYLGKFVDRRISNDAKRVDAQTARDNRQLDDMMKFRSELVERIKYLEGRVDTIFAENIRLVRENAELSVRVEQYRKEIEDLRSDLNAKKYTDEEILANRERIQYLEEIRKGLQTRVEELESELVKYKGKGNTDGEQTRTQSTYTAIGHTETETTSAVQPGRLSAKD